MMDILTLEEAQSMLLGYKLKNEQLWHALCMIHKYVDVTDAQLAEENISRSQILNKAREMKREYQMSCYEGMIIPGIVSVKD